MSAARPAPIGVSDAERLAALDAYDILDTVPEQGFDDVVRLATHLCAAPVALVSLVAADRQWFKARVGFPEPETDLDRSVCAYALAEPDLLVIPDLAADPRTASNPLVAGPPHIRFYAGAPLRTSAGHVLGSLCVIDTVPRPQGLTAEQADDLRALAAQVMTQLAMRRAVAERDELLDVQYAKLRQAQRLDVIAKASSALVSARNPGAVLEPILAAGAASVGFEQSFIYDLAQDGEHLLLRYSVGTSEELRASLACRHVDGPLCGIVVRTKRPLVLSDIMAGAEPRYEIARVNGFNAFAGYPIVSRGALVGVVSFTTSAPAFDADALSFFETLARLVSGVRERLDNEKAVRDSDTRSRLAQEAANIGTFELNVASGLIGVSAEFARIFGQPATGIYSPEAFESLVLPEDRHFASNAEAREAGTFIPDVEYRIRRANDGAVRWVARHASLARDEAGQVTRMFGTVQDVTERREAQEALRESEARFRTILDTVESAFAIVEVKFDADDRPVDYRFVEANPAFERQAGVNLVGKWVTEFAPGLEQFWFETYGRVAWTGEPASFENYAEAFKRWFDVRAVRVGKPEERRIAILFSDVTARKRAEADLRASEALARANVERVQLALAAGAIIGTWFWDIVSDRFTVDEAFASAFGLDPALGRDGIPLAQIVATVHPDDQAGLAAAIDEAIARGGAYAHQYRVRRADGRYYWIEANGRVDHAPDGTPLSFPGVLLDVEGRRADEARRDALLRLGDRLRDLTAAEDMIMAACEILGTTLDVMLVGYGDVDAQAETITVERDWTARGARSLAGTRNFREYGTYIEDFKRGDTVIVTDCRTDPRTRDNAEALEAFSARAFVNTPMLERGAFVALLYVSTAEVREWGAEDLAFIQDVASRLRLAVGRARSEAGQAVLNQELSHRMKNMMTLVQAMADQTLRAVPDRAPVDNFTRRLQALSSAHVLLLGRNWESARVMAAVASALEAFGHIERFEASGPEVMLGPQSVVSLSLLVHELATNAMKYGALSNDTGRVSLAWEIVDEGGEATFVMHWREMGGPPAVEPTRRGFGSRLIRSGLVGTGGVTLRYLPTGLEADMTARLSHLQTS